MIGVYKTNGTTPVDWCRSYHLYKYGNCDATDKNMKSLAECLFLNESGANGFSYSEQTDSHYQDRTWHDTRVKKEGPATTYDVKVTQVRYKGLLLSPSEYSSDYNRNSRTITLNVPDYVTDTSRLQVKANVKDSNNTWGSGHDITFEDGFDISERQALIINTVNKSPNYTVRVVGGTVDGKEDSVTKKYLEPFSIAPTVPEGKVFSHWEIEGDNADDITGFEKYAKSPAKLEIPKHDVTFKAVFKEKVSKIDIELYKPKCKDLIASYTTANIKYTTANGVESTESVDVEWRKHITDRTQDKFDFNTLYDASFSFSDSPDGNFGFADANKLKICLNGMELSNENYRYLNHFENGGGVYGTAEDSDPVKQRRVYITYPYRTDKANVLTVESPAVEIPSGISVEELNKLLPDSVKITYEIIDGEKTASVPVSLGELPTSISNEFTINGTVKIPENLDATEEQKNITITVKVTSDKKRLAKPTASVADGETISPNKKITLSSADGATIWYKIDNGAYTKYNADTEIDPQGEAGKIVDRKITAYCTKDGYLQSEFLTLNIKVDNGSFYTVKIVDKNGAIYGYASGAGEYTVGADVKIKATESDPEKCVSSWSADEIALTEEQKTASEFTFEMPAKNVTITAESFRYYVSKLYLSSITPIADNPLPQMPKIIYAEDIKGNAIENAPLNIKLWQWQKFKSKDSDITEEFTYDETYKTILGEKYRAIVQIEPQDGVSREICDDFTVYVDGKECSPDSLFGSNTYLFYWDFTAVYDELKSVNLGDSITAYTGNYVEFPETIGVKTRYGSITTADVTWEGADNVNTSTAGDYNVTAKLTLPNNVEDTNNLATKDVTINVRDIINSVKLTTTTDIPVKSGNPLPTEVTVASNGASLVENSFSVSPNDGTAVSGTKYTITAKVAPAENCEFGANTIFKINGISMNASPAENGEYELTYTFTAHEVQSYVVIVNGGESQAYNEGNSVEISTSADGFYKWTAETVYKTTETVIGDNNEQKEITVTHRNPVNIFADGDEYKAKTSFVMPKLADGSRLEITANNAHGIIAYDKQIMTADIVADKAYKGIKIIFAAYSNGELALVKWVDADLAEGLNTVTAPEAFSITGADTIKVMVWTDFENIIPLFEDFEKQITGDETK